MKIHTLPTLDHISINAHKGNLVCVIGSVGSGSKFLFCFLQLNIDFILESTFLMSLMNEIDILSGKVVVNGKIAYASQEPWSFNASVQDNILFGKPLDQVIFCIFYDFYLKVYLNFNTETIQRGN